MPAHDTRLARLTRLPLDAAGPLRGALLDRGIDALILGEHRVGLGGVIPIPDAWVEICVPEHQLGDAQQLLSDVAGAAPTDESGQKVCPQCAERSPGDWLECWSCGADLTQAASSEDRPPSTSAAGGRSPSLPARRRPWPFSVAVLFAAFFAYQWLALRAVTAPNPDDPIEQVASMESGCMEARLKTTGQVLDAWCDTRGTSAFDLARQYDVHGALLTVAYDRNEDGVFELTERYDRKERLTVEWLDHDGDGVFDFDREHHPDGSHSVWVDVDGNGYVDTRGVWQKGKLLRIDRDLGHLGSDTQGFETVDIASPEGQRLKTMLTWPDRPRSRR